MGNRISFLPWGAPGEPLGLPPPFPLTPYPLEVYEKAKFLGRGMYGEVSHYRRKGQTETGLPRDVAVKKVIAKRYSAKSQKNDRCMHFSVLLQLPVSGGARPEPA